MALLDKVRLEDAADKNLSSNSRDFMPAAGPHDRPELTNYDACPGCGSFPSQTEAGAEIDPGAG